MNNKAFDIGDVGKERENVERVDETPSSVLVAVNFKGENRSGAVGE